MFPPVCLNLGGVSHLGKYVLGFLFKQGSKGSLVSVAVH